MFLYSDKREGQVGTKTRRLYRWNAVCPFWERGGESRNLTHIVDSIRGDPVKALEKHQKAIHQRKRASKVVTVIPVSWMLHTKASNSGRPAQRQGGRGAN